MKKMSKNDHMTTIRFEPHPLASSSSQPPTVRVPIYSRGGQRRHSHCSVGCGCVCVYTTSQACVFVFLVGVLCERIMWNACCSSSSIYLWNGSYVQRHCWTGVCARVLDFMGTNHRGSSRNDTSPPTPHFYMDWFHIHMTWHVLGRPPIRTDGTTLPWSNLPCCCCGGDCCCYCCCRRRRRRRRV
jgi:hypothetical protein